MLVVGMTLYEHKVRYQDPRNAELFVPFMRLVVQRTGQNIPNVISDPVSWHRLLACPIFLRHAISYAVMKPEEVMDPALVFSADEDDWLCDERGYEY